MRLGTGYECRLVMRGRIRVVTRRGPSVFVSYRRSDTSHVAGRLYDRLAERLGDDRVFMDVDSIRAGSDFADVIREAVDLADVMLVLVAGGWAEARDEHGDRRLEREDDVVRLEITTGMERGLRIIPVLVDGAAMPGVSQLPAAIQDLSRRHALPVDHVTFRSDADALISNILGATGGAGAGSRGLRRMGGWWFPASLTGLAAVMRAIRHPQPDQVPGFVALAAAASLIGAGTLGPPVLRPADVQVYVVGLGVVVLVASGLVLGRRPSPGAANGVLVGAAAASAWGLGLLIGELPGVGFRWRYVEFDLRVCGHLALLVAAFLGTRVVRQEVTGATARGLLRAPPAVTVAAAVLGSTALLVMVWQVVDASAADGGNLQTRSVTTVVLAVLALVLPVGAVLVAPPRLGVAVLLGWVGGAGAVTAGMIRWILRHPGTVEVGLRNQPSLVPALLFAATLLLVLLTTPSLRRRPPPAGGLEGLPAPTARRPLVALAALLSPLAIGAGVIAFPTPADIDAIPLGLAVSRDGRRLYVLSNADLVSVVDTSTNAVVGDLITVGPSAHEVVASPDRRHIYVMNGGDITVIDASTNAVAGAPIPVRSPTGIAASPNGERLYVASQDGVVVIDTRTGAALPRPIAVPGSPLGLAVSPDESGSTSGPPEASPSLTCRPGRRWPRPSPSAGSGVGRWSLPPGAGGCTWFPISKRVRRSASSPSTPRP